jgi:hypothetical protein
MWDGICRGIEKRGSVSRTSGFGFASKRIEAHEVVYAASRWPDMGGQKMASYGMKPLRATNERDEEVAGCGMKTAFSLGHAVRATDKARGRRRPAVGLSDHEPDFWQGILRAV